MYDKDMKCWVSAGFGFVAVKGGDGPEHDGGSSIHEHQGPVDLGDFGGAVRNRTNNVSELVAFIHALRYARTAPEARDKSICLRHDSKYAALVSCGVYKGKKNKALVAIARDEWKLTAASKKEGVQQGNDCGFATSQGALKCWLGQEFPLTEASISRNGFQPRTPLFLEIFPEISEISRLNGSADPSP